jgi:hypothetical protein
VRVRLLVLSSVLFRCLLGARFVVGLMYWYD